MEQPFIICSTEVNSYEKHCELIEAGYQLQKCGNAADIYVHNDMPNLWDKNLKLGRNLCTRRRSLKYMLKELTALEYKEYLAEILNDAASSKSVKLLSTVTHSIFFNTFTKLYELARMIAPKNHNIAIHKSIDDDTQTDGVNTSFSSAQMESKQ